MPFDNGTFGFGWWTIIGMKMQHTCASLIVLGALLTGCVGTGPNTQQGAVAGGALGALAGAILGNNSHGHDALGGAVLGGIAGAVAGGTLGNAADHQNGTLYTSEAAATSDVVVASPPPAPLAPTEVVVAQPAPDMVWIAGCWVFGPRGYVWAPGHWVRPPPYRRHYVGPHWRRRGRGYVYIHGYWR